EELNAKVDGIAQATVPTVNDKNPANGVQDDIDAKIQAAVDAKTKADNAASDANTDGVVTAEEAAAVETANQELAAAKAAAKEAIEQAPDAKREELNAKVDGLAPATVPTDNDKNPANGVQDDIDAKIQAAVDAKTKADNAERVAKTRGAETAEEAAAVETANQELAAAKAAAKE